MHRPRRGGCVACLVVPFLLWLTAALAVVRTNDHHKKQEEIHAENKEEEEDGVRNS